MKPKVQSTESQRIVQLSSILTTISEINHLILKERDPEKLLQKACEHIVKLHFYKSAWIITLDKSGKAVKLFHSGLEHSSRALENEFLNNQWPDCCVSAREKKEIVFQSPLSDSCKNCLLLDENPDTGSFTLQLEYEGTVFGILHANLSSEISSDEEEHNLFKDIAGNLAFALNDIQILAQKNSANENLEKRSFELNESIKELNCLYRINEISILPDITLPEFFIETVGLIQMSWQYPEQAEARIIYLNDAFQSEKFKESEWMMQATIVIENQNVGSVEVCYQKDISAGGRALFLESEMFLLQQISRQLGETITRIENEETLKISELRLSEAHLIAKLGSWDLDLIHNRLDLSDEVRKLYGLSGAEVLPDLDVFLDSVHPEDKEMVARSMQDSFEKETTYELVHRIVKPNKEIGYVKVSSRNFLDKDGKVVRIAGTVKDISDRVKIERELVEACKRAEDADKLKSAFLMNMSHEIRTPMNAIIGFSDLLTRKGNTQDQMDSYAEMIRNSSNRLLHLIDDILEVSKIESGTIQFSKSECNVNKLMSELLQSFENQKTIIGKENINLIAGPKKIENLKLITDPFRLKQVLSNLLDNALKYSEQGSVELGYLLKSGEGAPDLLEFYVRDTGVGIDPDKLDFVFERFTKVENSMKLYDGAGLGLTISKNLVTLMGGNMWVESQQGVGSTFYFSLPWEESKSHSEEDVPYIEIRPAEHNWKDKTMLIVEDEESNFKLLEYGLEETGVQIIWAKNGKLGVEECKKNPAIDLVIMDVKMPVMDGYTATRKIKEHRDKLPVIAVTAYATEEDALRSKDAGCDALFAKPVDIDSLIQSLDNYIHG